MQLTAAHWVFLAGVVVILAAMIMRKTSWYRQSWPPS